MVARTRDLSASSLHRDGEFHHSAQFVNRVLTLQTAEQSGNKRCHQIEFQTLGTLHQD
jgi:hypothetical protein